MRLRRSDPASPGITRVRRGRGFRYYGPDGAPITDADQVRRIKELVVPPGWRDVWICALSEGHIQACGTDDAGRRQYIYHPEWRRRSEEAKYDDMLDFAESLPGIRRRLIEHLDLRGLVRERVLAAAIRLIDLDFLRAGGQTYATWNDSYGVATLRREHVHHTRGTVVFEFQGKAGRKHRVECADPGIHRVVSGLQRVRSPDQDLFAYRVDDGWHDVTSDDLNAYLREITGEEHTVKMFRTWHATVLAAVGVAVAVPTDDDRALARLRAHVAREVADHLGNTEAVARNSYIDPRIFHLHERGVTIAASLPGLGREVSSGEPATQGDVEEAVLRMLRQHGDA